MLLQTLALTKMHILILAAIQKMGGGLLEREVLIERIRYLIGFNQQNRYFQVGSFARLYFATQKLAFTSKLLMNVTT